MRRFVLFIALLLFAALGLGVVFLWVQGLKADKLSSYLTSATLGYSEQGSFVAEGVLESSSGKTLKSLHQRRDCLAYETKVELCEWTEDSDGEEKVRRRGVFSKREQVGDLKAVFETGSVAVNVHAFPVFYKFQVHEVEERPDYVESRPAAGRESWYEISESVYASGQTVLLLAGRDAKGHLEKHSEAGELMLYPGDRDECVKYLAGAGKTYRTVALILLAVSLLGVGLAVLFLRGTRS